MKAFEVLQRGALTTIQDLGRFGYQRYGVSLCGAMDKFALRVGNLLVGNCHEGEAALEITLLGPKLRALADLQVSFTGADLSPRINGQLVPLWHCLSVHADDVISFGPSNSGCRAYLCVFGGIDVPLTMGSRSTHTRAALGGFGRAMQKGDVVSVRDCGVDDYHFLSSNQLSPEMIPIYTDHLTVRALRGPQDDYFTAEGLQTFWRKEYTVSSESDRMGYRLQGPKIQHSFGADIITDATPPGSVQVPGDGMPIILLADSQTTGGYPKIAVVTSTDQDRLAQVRPGDRIRFEEVNISQAHQLLMDMENAIRAIRKSMMLLT